MLQHKLNIQSESQIWSSCTMSGLETDRAYSAGQHWASEINSLYTGWAKKLHIFQQITSLESLKIK